MDKNKKISIGWLTPTIVAALIPIVFILLVASGDDDTIDRNSPYKDYVNYEWMDLSYYEANKGKYLGRRPEKDMSMDIFSGYLYSLKGIPEDEMLYCEQPDMYGGKIIEILMSEECEEPIKRMPIKKIEITMPDKSKVIISDKETLNSIQQLFCEGPRTEISFYYTFNAKVYFDVECDLTYTCGIFERDDGSIVLAYHDNDLIYGPHYDFCYYDVTELLKDKL